jgi:exopolyphosphatase/pppGpp-phosphohydrolase
VGLPKNRADVILTGVAIYQAVMEQFGFGELRISTRGLRFAVVMEATG